MLTLQEAVDTLKDPLVAKRLLGPFVASDVQVCRKLDREGKVMNRCKTCPVTRYLKKLTGLNVEVGWNKAYVVGSGGLVEKEVDLPHHVEGIIKNADARIRNRKTAQLPIL